MTSATRVLVVDDDPALLRALRVALNHAGYEVVTASNGEQGITETAVSAPDVIVLDLGLPDIDGLAVCRRIRQWSEVPIIVLSATAAELRKVAALDGGADDYVTKPFGMAELEARIRTALRHRRNPPVEQASELTAGRLHLDLVHHEAHLDGNPVKLTAREFELLSFLVQNAGKVATHEMILKAVWGESFGKETQYLHAYIHRLRQKLGPEATITTVPGIGYTLDSVESEGAVPS
jgi:two-component system, OmpR family, KDP operon response regulator KdpE